MRADRRAAAMTRRVKILLIALVVLGVLAIAGAYVVAPYVARPALLKDSAAINLSLADAAMVGVSFDTKGVDPLDGPYAKGFPGNGSPAPLCTAKDVLDAESLPATCLVFWPWIRDDDCRNDRGCARLRVDPSILREPRLSRPILAALKAPCATFARSPGVYSGRGLHRRVGFQGEIGASARRLGCEADSFKGRPSADLSTGVIAIQF